MTKILTALSLVQIAAIFFLYNMLVEIDHKVTPIADAGQSASASVAAVNDPFQDYSYDAYPDEERLRQIIREELGAALGYGSGQGQYSAPANASASIDPAELEYRREEVAQQLEYYASVGSISNTDMQKLQTEIARLDPAGRTEMLQKLTQELNSGRLDGRF